MLDVADVATSSKVQKPVPTSPDKAALKYLEASGVAAISIIADADGIAISVGIKRDAVAAYWLPQEHARSVAAKARGIMGDAGDIESVISAVQEAAAQVRVTLTEHSIAITRAGAMAEQLDSYVDTLRASGVLKQFTKTYNARRLAAAAKGQGFMTFANAELRFKRALIPLLQNGGKTAIGASIFATVFDT